LPWLIWSELLDDLGFCRAPIRVAGAKAPHQLQEANVRRGQLVKPALPRQGQHLHGPVADPADRAQAPPSSLVVGIVEIHPARGDLAGGAHDRGGASRRQIEGRQQRGRLPGEHVRGGSIAHPRHLTAAPQPRDQAPLDAGGPLELDQLLADGPDQRLERIRAAGCPQRGVGSHGSPDQRIEPEALVKGAEVLIDAERDPHPFDPPLSRVAVIRIGGEYDAVGGRLGDAHNHRLLAGVQQPLEHAAAHPGQAIEAVAQRERERPARANLHP
jgi:hypothetical protein